MPRRFRLAIALSALLAPAALAGAAAALPLFSRTESMPCAGCHMSVPRLNAFGTRYLLAGDRAPQAPPPAAGAAPPAPAASVVAQLGLRVVRADTLAADGGRGRRTLSAFQPYALEVHAAGALSHTLAYGLEAALDSATDLVRIPVVFVRFDRLAGRALALRAGRFETGLPWFSPARRVTWTPFRAPLSIAAEGLELLSAHAAWNAAAGLVNSERTPADAGPYARSYSRLENTYLWATRALGGQQVGARVLFARQPSDLSYHAWLQRLQGEIGGSFGTDRIRVEPAWVLDRFDDRPVAEEHLRHHYMVLQALALLDSGGATALALRLEHEHVAPTTTTRSEDHDLEAVRLQRWISPAAGLALEGSHSGDDVGGTHAWRLDATVTLAY